MKSLAFLLFRRTHNKNDFIHPSLHKCKTRSARLVMFNKEGLVIRMFISSVIHLIKSEIINK
jgi:hypothetical protein